MRLKASERTKLMKGEFPKLVREHLDFKIGEEIVLKTTTTHAGTIPEVSIRILGRHKTKNGSWQAVYLVRDDRGLYVNQGLGYTRSPARALDREAPIIDPAVIEQYAKENEVSTRLLRAEQTGTGKLATEYAIREQKRAWKASA